MFITLSFMKEIVSLLLIINLINSVVSSSMSKETGHRVLTGERENKLR